MSDRHFPRLCQTCGSPLARKEDTCWRCGADWASRPKPSLRVIPGGAPEQPFEEPQAEVAVEAAIPVAAAIAVEAVGDGRPR